MNNQTAAILGAGAVGSYFLWGFEEKYKDNLWVIAEGERKKRLETEGLWINGKRHKLHVRTPEEAHGADFLLVAAKYDGLQGALDAIETIVGENTIVISLLNGVDSEEIIAQRIGRNHLLHAVMFIASERTGNSVLFDPKKTRGVVYGDATGSTESAKMQASARLFAGTPIRTRVSDRILEEIWYKFAFNISFNLPQAIIGCGIGAYAESRYVADLRWKLRDEVCRVAAAEGVDISEPSPLEKLRLPSAPASRYSTLQDLDAGRHTEIEMFSGTILRLAEKHGLEVPYNAFAYDLIKALEEKNDGKFAFP